MSDSRFRGDETRRDGGGGRASGWHDRAGAFHLGRWPGVNGLLAALAVLATASLRPCGARAQDAGAAPPAAPALVPESVEPLSYRYRFLERYGPKEDPAKPDLVVEYKVASIETLRRETEQAQGAPDRQELKVQTIYTERPARVGKLGEVTDAVRRYDVFRVLSAAPPALAPNPSLFGGLTIWYHLRAGQDPEILSLNADRPIRQQEYGMITGSDHLILPQLSAVLPRTPVRVGDPWPIPRPAGRILLSGLPDRGDYALDGRLVEVRQAAAGTALTAVIEIDGEMQLEAGPGSVKARIHFDFERPAAAKPAPEVGETTKEAPRRNNPVPGRDKGIVDARGWISEVRMGRMQTIPIDTKGRLNEYATRQLVLQRRRVTPPPGGAAVPDDLVIPDKPPIADASNSWILYDDPLKRFHFLHPQELVVQDVTRDDDLHMVYRRPNGQTDVLIVRPVPRQADPALERERSNPQAFARNLRANWARDGHQLVQGEAGWLPDQEWGPLKRRVYRVEAAIKPDREGAAVRGAARFYLDAYLVVFTRGDCYHFDAMTDRDDHVTFRDQAEEVIRRFDLYASAPGVAPAPAQPPPVPPSTTRPTPSRPGPPPVPPSSSTP